MRAALALMLMSVSASASSEFQCTLATGPRHIHADGVVVAGAEAGCLLIKADGNTYLPDQLPADVARPGTQVSFDAMLHQRPSNCQQGQGIDIVHIAPLP